MTSKTVAITAPTGMLGSMVYTILKEKYRMVLIYRDEEKMKTLDEAYGGVTSHKKVQCDLMDLYQDYVTGFPTSNIGSQTLKLIDEIGEIDAFINCAGIIKPYSLKDPLSTMFVNGAVPHILSSIYKDKLIHITTDCAYDGITGAPYTEESLKTPNDLYGLSKSIGEPSRDSLVLRTSIIGPEIIGFASLISWFKKQEGQTIKGFTNHLWNGITTKEFGNICDRIISHREEYPKNGLFHIFSNDISKYDMVVEFKKKYNVNVNIEKAEPAPVDRRLHSVYDVCSKLQIPRFEEMLHQL